MTRGAVGRIVDDWRALLALPDDAHVQAWGWYRNRAGDVKAEMRERLHWKISSQCPWYGLGRKWGEVYQRELHRDCWAIRDKVQKRVRLYQIMTPELRRRYAHLLDERGE